jgi:RHS repeat-associated protein
VIAWDWATGVPEMLYDGQYAYLVGHDTLGWEGARTPMGPVEWTYVLPDALGSVRQETDATGAVTALREWSPYGEELGGAQTGLGYTGEWLDTGVGLQYLRARWYQPQVGRLTQADSWEGDLIYPQSLNRWAYVEGNPIKFTDPLGLRAIIPWSLYYQHWGRSLIEGNPDIVNDLGNEDDAMALGAIAKIELNFQGNPNYEGLPLAILAVHSLYRTCTRYPLYDSDYPDDMTSYATQPIYPDRDYNQYDWLISGWVDYWNWRALQAGKSYQLDPNFVKAVVYIETTLGYEFNPNNSKNVGLMQLDTEATNALMGVGGGSVQWGAINVVDRDQPSQNIGGGVRWLMYKYEVVAQQESWLKAYAYYAGYWGDVEGERVQDVATVYNTGFDVKWKEGNHHLFRRSVLFPDPR